MRVLAVGLNHRTAPLEVRDRVALTRAQVRQRLGLLRDRGQPGVVISTCNRTEVYTASEEAGAGERAMLELLCDGRGVAPASLYGHRYLLEHTDAARHLFRVAAGVDSMILGESQILGQVRDAYSAAVAAGTAPAPLSHLFHQAMRVGKRARRETDIGRNALSVSHASAQLARGALGDLSGRSVVVVGVGEAGKLVARALARGGAGEVWVANRTYEHARELAGELGGRALPFDDVGRALAWADIVVGCSGAPDHVLTREAVEAGLGGRDGSPLLLIDLAVPRDIDPSVADLEGVRLYDVDALEDVSEANRRGREREAEKVERMVDQEVASFSRWWESLSVLPAVASLHRRGERLRRAEMSRLLARLPGLDPEEREGVEAMSRALVRKLLHDPTVVLRSRQDPAALEAARWLFRLDEEQG